MSARPLTIIVEIKTVNNKNMIKPITISSIVVGFFLILFPSNLLFSQSCPQLRVMNDMLKRFHVQPRLVDDSLSTKVYNDMFELLDPYGIYFIKSDMDEFSTFQYKLDDAVNNNDCEFVSIIEKRYAERLKEVDTLIGTLLSKPLDYNSPDEIFFSLQKTRRVSDDMEDRKKRWARWLKYQTLNRIFKPRGDEVNTDQIDNVAFQKMEKSARWDIKTFEQRKIRNILTEYVQLSEYIFDQFASAFALYFDPHTEYYTNAEKNSFQYSLSSENLSFGINIKENDKNEIEITKVIPGSSSWKSNQINKGDIILSASFPGSLPIDLSFAAIKEAYGILYEKDILLLTLTIKKPNGSIKKVTIQKEKLEEDENVIQSFILEGEKRIGYIFLPSFYSDWEDASGLGCANDLAKKLLVLQKEKIDGLILDIRNNGGGSVQEAIDLAGIFIDVGPVTMSKSQSEILVKKDMNRGAIYNGPLLIMVNGLSASASEIFSAAMQDYQRAIIVGSTTYGKSTGQNILPITENVFSNFDLPGKYGYLKITSSIFYRINSKTHQVTGVVPDVLLPDLFQNLKYREEFGEQVLKADSIVKKLNYTPFNSPPKGDLQELSSFRLRSNESFKQVMAIADTLKAMLNEEYSIQLTIEGFKKTRKRGDYDWASWEKALQHKTTSFKVLNDQYMRELVKIDDYEREMNEFQIENIELDIYIDEAYQIMIDFITLENQ